MTREAAAWRFDGDLLRRLREGRGWTLRQLGARAGLAATTVMRAEDLGRLTFEHAVALARCFQLKTDAFAVRLKERT